jgi:hypothetical protein
MYEGIETLAVRWPIPVFHSSRLNRLLVDSNATLRTRIGRRAGGDEGSSCAHRRQGAARCAAPLGFGRDVGSAQDVIGTYRRPRSNPL